MLHVTRLTTGLQDLLCEGRFVDVRICCSDHSPSDGLGAHRAMLAAASPGLLGPSLQGEESEEEMVCLQLPDYTSSCVASVLSILYYGETWLESGDQEVATINSLLSHLGVYLEVCSEGCRMFVRQRSQTPTPAPAPPPPVVRKQKIKAEPQESQESISPARIKKERMEERERGSSSVFPLVQSSSLLKCPNTSCNFCALTVPEIEIHINECSLAPGPSQETHSHSTGESLESFYEMSLDSQGDVKPHLKREFISGIKQEATDPLERNAELKKECAEVAEVEARAEDDDGLSDVVTVSSDSSTTGPVGCDEPNCSYVTRSMSSYKAHIMMHQRKDLLKDVKKTCPVCKLGFRTVIKLKEHLQNHGTRMPGNTIRCNVDKCDQNIVIANLYDHIIFGHFGDKYKLKCDQCQFKTTTSSKLKNHLMMHLDERPFKCRDCPPPGKTFRTNSQLTEHSLIVHSKQQTISCNECLAAFNTQSQLNKHKQSKHSNILVSCCHCEKTFSSSQSLKSHERNVHNKSQSKLVCSTCGHLPGGCQCAGNRVAHQTVACPLCGKDVISKNLPSHLHYHRQSTLRPYICQECSQTFTHASSLKRHALLHTGNKQFRCEQCGKEFFQKVAYETHCKSHTKDRLHCKGCNQPFLTKYLLNFHLKSKTVCREVY